MKNSGLHKQAGFTIVELMVTMVIIMLVTGGVYKVFNNSLTTYRVQEGLSRLQENARFGMSFLTRDIREAGYRGCASYGPLTNSLNNSASLDYYFDIGIQGYTSASFTALNLAWVPPLTPVNGSDVLVIRTSRENGVGVVKNNSSAELFAVVVSSVPDACAPNKPRVSGICEGDILLVSDCSKSRIFQAGNIQVASGDLNVTHPATGTPGNAISSWGGNSGPPSERFGPDAEIIKVTTLTYFVAVNAAGQPALYRREGTGNPQELVEGVEAMHVRYGVDTDGDRSINNWDQTVAQVETVNPAEGCNLGDIPGCWARVRSVRIGLLMRTPNEISRIETDANPHDVQGTNFGPYNDRRLRRVFTATVGVRNRLP